MSEIIHFCEELVLAIADFIEYYPQLATFLIAVAILWWFYKKIEAGVKKYNTKTEQEFPEIEKLKKVETKTTVTEQGHFWINLSRVLIVGFLLLLFLKLM